jgi:hypothetical protein
MTTVATVVIQENQTALYMMEGGKLVTCVVSNRPRVKLQETSFNDLLRTANATHRSTVGTVQCTCTGTRNV